MLAGGAALLISLVACSGGFSAAPVNFDVGIDPNPFGFDVDVDPETGQVEYIVPSHTFSFANKAGAVGVTIEGYDVEYYEASDNPAFPGDFIQQSSGSLNVYVPAGIVCDGLREDDAFDGCSVNSPGALFARGPVRFSPPSFVMPIDVAIQLYNLVDVGGAVGAYAHVYFYGTDDLQRPFRTPDETPYQFAVQIPLGGN